MDFITFTDLMDLHAITMMMALKKKLNGECGAEEAMDFYNRRINLLRYGVCPRECGTGKNRIKKRRIKIMKKLAKAVTAVLAVGALGTLVFMRMTKKEEPMEAVPDPSVQVENPAADTISISTDLTGTVEPADVVYVAAMGSGEVLEVYVNQGEMVERTRRFLRSTISSWNPPGSS